MEIADLCVCGHVFACSDALPCWSRWLFVSVLWACCLFGFSLFLRVPVVVAIIELSLSLGVLRLRGCLWDYTGCFVYSVIVVDFVEVVCVFMYGAALYVFTF